MHMDLLQVWVIDTGIRFRNIKHVVSFHCQPRNGWAWVGWRRWEGIWCISHSESCSYLDFSKDTYVQSLHHTDRDEKENYSSYSCKCVFHCWTTPSVVHYELILSINLVIIFDQCNYIALYLLRAFICSTAKLPYTHFANPACHSFLWETLGGEFPPEKGIRAFQRGLLGESSW